ncbi:hypothetical protein BN1708_000393 [Verticillium longisporum]|uniref:Carboxylesterase type B domain-containing protein n=1 Tax=Verticillium longisporum TaxID=100787 RepID=A0A0G4LCA0_VERLO|nr:hypothetical protein BN1708_000393 [Verticillium longisporum]
MPELCLEQQQHVFLHRIPLALLTLGKLDTKMVKLNAFVFGLALRHAVAAEPPSKAGSARGRLTILAHNDLENEPSSGSGAVLIDRVQDQASALKACGQLSEALWSGEGEELSFASLKTSLTYEVYQKNYPSNAKFWIASGDGCKCRAIGTDGSLHRQKCSDRLPVLCSQSAPVSSATADDTSSSFQVTQKVGDAQFTGYRDFYTWKFRGVRYAPTAQRFDYSTTLRPKGSISALTAGADCLQHNAPESSDDCLFLNIWTTSLPASTGGRTQAKPALKPVLVYIHGGGYVEGSGKNGNLDLTNIASRGDIVAVSINYRLGNTGMIAFNDGIHKGNIALGDQISALKWVAENIAAFGGDPDRVTISGESAGAMSVRNLLTSPEARGLYAGALLQSDGQGGPFQVTAKFATVDVSYKTFTQPILEAVNCNGTEDEVACLRNVPAQQLANLPVTANAPVIDGKILRTPFLALDGSGPRYARDVPVLTGVTRDEAAIFIPLLQIDWSTLDFPTWTGLLYAARSVLGIDPDAILANLLLWGVDPSSTGEQLFNATTEILTLNWFTCLDRATAYAGTKNGAFAKTYAFNFYRTYSPTTYTTNECSAAVTPAHPLGGPSQEYFRCHGGSQLTMFGNYRRVGLGDRDGRDQDFSRLVLDYWASFVRSGDPNPAESFLAARGYNSTLAEVKKSGEWKEVDPEAPEWMILEADSYMAPFGDADKCAVLGQPLNYWENTTRRA